MESSFLLKNIFSRTLRVAGTVVVLTLAGLVAKEGAEYFKSIQPAITSELCLGVERVSGRVLSGLLNINGECTVDQLGIITFPEWFPRGTVPTVIPTQEQ
jgi:hypothetical protein